MNIHAIQNGFVRIKTARVERHRHGLPQQPAIFTDRNWEVWLCPQLEKAEVVGATSVFGSSWPVSILRTEQVSGGKPPSQLEPVKAEAVAVHTLGVTVLCKFAS